LTTVVSGYSALVDVEHWTLLASVQLEGGSAVRQAREAVRLWSAPLVERRVLPDVVTATGEVVKNAMQHAWPPFVLTVCHQPTSGRVRVGVADGNPAPPQFDAGDPWATHGHGLSVVDAVAVAWGSTPTATGKEVWFEVEAERPQA
jgi:hypothetical protein